MDHTYQAPLVEILPLLDGDILTFSNGFDGENHEFFLD